MANMSDEMKKKMEDEMSRFELELASTKEPEPPAMKPRLQNQPLKFENNFRQSSAKQVFVPHSLRPMQMPPMMQHFQMAPHFAPQPLFGPQMMPSIFTHAPIEIARNPTSYESGSSASTPAVYSAPPVKNITKPKPAAQPKPDYTPTGPSVLMMKEKTSSVPVTANMDLYKYVGPIDRKNKKKKMVMMAGNKVWEDNSLLEWDPDDFRIFCGDLGNDVTDEVLARAFNKYASYVKSKVIRDKRTNKTKGYGFVSFKDPQDFIKAMREMNGKFVGSRPIKLRKSCWRDRAIENVKKRTKEKEKLGLL